MRNPIFSIINVCGLAIGIATFIFILEYIGLEKGVNQFHSKVESIYRVTNLDKDGNRWVEVAPGWGEVMKNKIPEIDKYCRFEEGVATGIVQNTLNNLSFREENIGYVEGNFFDFFSFPLIKGSSADFNQPYSLFLSQSAVKKYFKNIDPIDKTLTLNNQFGSTPYIVKGIFKDMGDDSDIKFDMVFSLETLKNPKNLNGNGWANLDNIDSGFMSLYFSVKSNVDPIELEKKVVAINKEFNKEDDGVEFRLQPLKNLHLADSLDSPLPTSGSLRYVYILGAIAFLILLIAWLNYVNLSTASSLKRSGEVGIKKAIGATRGQVVTQFLIETSLINSLSFLLALGLLLIFQNSFNQLIGKTITIGDLNQSSIWILGLISIFTGSLFSGLYTSFVMSEFNPIESLKGKLLKGKDGNFVRKSLVVFQFGISVALILATLIIYRQLQFMQSEKLGFNAEQVLVIYGPNIGQDSTFQNRSTAFKAYLDNQSFVKSSATSNTIPGMFYNFKTSGFTQPKSLPDDKYKSYAFLIIGEEYLLTYEIPMKAGRNFTAAECNVSWNDNSKILINEKALKFMGFETAQEAMLNGIQWDERHLDILGVVADYHHSSLHHPIEPVIFYPQNQNGYYSVRLTASNLPTKLSSLEKEYTKAFPNNPFEYTFIDESFSKAYKEDEQFGRIFTTAAVLAIFIACLGLFGLAMFTVEYRTKEIGLRKVLGASVSSIIKLLSYDFLKLVILAIILGTPIALFGMKDWLQNFTFHVAIEWWLPVIAGIIVIVVALITVGFQSLKAAITNPVKSLKND
jgi:putative ABC transport system permease protein